MFFSNTACSYSHLEVSFVAKLTPLRMEKSVKFEIHGIQTILIVSSVDV